MTTQKLVLAPDPIFKQKSEPVGKVTDEVRRLMDDLLDTIHDNQGVGIAATMIGVLKRVIVVDVKDDGANHKLFMADPEIISKSDESQTFMEGSLCFPGIMADVKRSRDIEVKYLDYEGDEQKLKASGFLSTCIQHEIDYLNGVVFVDYLSKMKRDRLMKKMQKYIGQHMGHECGAGCAH